MGFVNLLYMPEKKVKESVKKISRLIYFIIFMIISAFTFILPQTDRSFFGEFSKDFLKDTLFTVAYFKVCKPRGVGCLPTFIDGAGALREVTIYDLTISAEDYRRKYFKSFKDNSNWREKQQALNKWNKTTLNRYYKPATLVKRGLKTTNAILNYLLFLISIPFFWYTRDLSLLFVKLLRGSWKKI